MNSYPRYRAEFRFHEGAFRWVMLRKDGPLKPSEVCVSTHPAETLEQSARNQAQVEWLADVNNNPETKTENPNLPLPR